MGEGEGEWRRRVGFEAAGEGGVVVGGRSGRTDASGRNGGLQMTFIRSGKAVWQFDFKVIMVINIKPMRNYAR